MKTCHNCQRPIHRLTRGKRVIYCSRKCSQAYRDLGRVRKVA